MTKKLERMKKIGLILSALFLTTCAHAQFPAKRLYVVDLTSGVCVEYDIVDATNLKVRLRQELPLQKGGACDRMAGFHRNEFKPVQNYIRDAIKACSK